MICIWLVKYVNYEYYADIMTCYMRSLLHALVRIVWQQHANSLSFSVVILSLKVTYFCAKLQSLRSAHTEGTIKFPY